MTAGYLTWTRHLAVSLKIKKSIGFCWSFWYNWFPICQKIRTYILNDKNKWYVVVGVWFAAWIMIFPFAFAWQLTDRWRDQQTGDMLAPTLFLCSPNGGTISGSKKALTSCFLCLFQFDPDVWHVRIFRCDNLTTLRKPRVPCKSWSWRLALPLTVVWTSCHNWSSILLGLEVLFFWISRPIVGLMVQAVKKYM